MNELRPQEPPPSRHRMRIWGIVTAVVVVVIAASAIAIRAILTPERLRAEVVRAASEATGLPTTLESAHLSFVPFGVAVEGLRVENDTMDGDFFTLTAGLVQLELRALLRKAVVVSQIRLENPIVRLRKSGERVLLPGKLAANAANSAANRGTGVPGPETSPGATMDVHVGAVAIDGGEIHLVTEDGAGDVDITGIECHGSLDLREQGNRMQSRGELKLGALALAALAPYRETLDRLSPTVEFDLDYRAREGTLRMETLRLNAPPLDLRLQGDLTGLPDAPAAALVLDRETLELNELLPLIPPSLFPEGRVPTASGPVAMSARIDGPLTDPNVPPRYDVNLEFGGADLGMEGFDVRIQGLTGRVQVAPGAVSLTELAGRLGPDGTFAVNGTVSGFENPESTRYDLAVRGNVDLGLVRQAGMLPDGTELDGKLDLDVTARGEAQDATGVQLGGHVNLANARGSTPDLPLPIENLTARVRLEGTDAIVDDFSGSLGSSTFRGKARIARALSEPHVTLEGSCPRLNVVELFPAPQASGSPGGRNEGEGAAPPAATDTPPLIPPMPPVPMDLTLRVDSLLVEAGSLAGVDITGTIRDEIGHFDAQVRGADFDGMILEQFTAKMDLQNSTATGTFQAPRANAHIVPLTNVRGNVSIDANDVVRVTDVTAALWNGTVSGSADVDMKDRDSPAFAIDTRASGMSADQFIEALTPATDVLSGVLDVQSSFSGKGATPEAIAKTLVGSGTLDATKGQLEKSPAVQAIWQALNLGGQESIPFEDLATKFAVEEGKIHTRDLAVAGANADWLANGTLAFDGTMDYAVTVELNDELSNLYRQRVGRELAALLSGTSGRLAVDLRIHGNAQSPKVDVDTKALAERAAQNLKGKLQDELSSGKDKLIEGLQGLLGADSTAADSTKPPKIEDALKNLLGGKKK